MPVNGKIPGLNAQAICKGWWFDQRGQERKGRMEHASVGDSMIDLHVCRTAEFNQHL